MPDGDGASEPKLEVKDGSYFIDGKKVVPESDLLGVKKSLEKQLETTVTTHTAELDTARQSQSTAETQLATANAELTKLREAQKQGAASSDEVAKAIKERDDAKKALEDTSKTSLELRKQLIIAAYPGVKAEALANKTPVELAAFEEALKVVGASRAGVGNYAFGGGSGSGQPLSPMDRAKLVLASASTGTRTVETK